MTSGGEIHAIIWSGGKMRDIGVPSGCQVSFGHGINDRGSVAGYALDSKENVHACLWKDGKPIRLKSKRTDAIALAVNNSDLVVGIDISMNEESFRAVAWKDGNLKELPLPSDYSDSEATGVNKDGVIVGAMFKNAAGSKRLGKSLFNLAYISFEELFTSQHFMDKIAAYGSPDISACLWGGDRVIDLNKVLPENSGWILLVATGINDRGQVTGIGVYKDQLRGFLLTPKKG